MKTENPIFTDLGNDFRADDMHHRLLEIYWNKKNLEEFLPQIATYSSPREMLSITLAQLSIMENQLIWLLREIAQKENTESLRKLSS